MAASHHQILEYSDRKREGTIMKTIAIALLLTLALVTPSFAKSLRVASVTLHHVKPIKIVPRIVTTTKQPETKSVNPIIISRDRALNG
jgi:hypothetical protein